jgi:hypothetical protein
MVARMLVKVEIGRRFWSRTQVAGVVWQVLF